jgi:lambda family phage minor tail protein L
MADTKLEVQKMRQDAKILLLEIDYTHLPGGTVIYLTDSVRDPSSVVAFNSNTYIPRRFALSGIDRKAGGSSGRPSLTIDNVDRYWWALVMNNNRLRNSKVIYSVVYRQHLDDGSDPDTSQHIERHEFELWQMSQISRLDVTFKLSAPHDNEQVMFGNQMLRNVCPRTYRVPTETTDEFVDNTSNPEKVDCPYVGTDYFTKDGTTTTDWSEDDCGQRPSDCTLRFPAGPIPYRGFSGLGNKTA